MNNRPTGFGPSGLRSGLVLSLSKDEVPKGTVSKPGTDFSLFVPGAYLPILMDW